MLTDKVIVGKFVLKNRLVKAPIHSETCVNGRITEKTIQHYDERTKGGRFGLVVVEHTFIRQDGMASQTQMSSALDENIKDLKCLADTIHRNGSLAILQLNHAGCGARREVTGCEPLSASDKSIVCGWPNSEPNPEKPRPMTRNEILAIEDSFFRAAERAMKAGYDGVNIHSAHGYLLNQFFSPITNKRTDEYNGYTIEGRTRIHREVIRGVRQVIGANAMLVLRLGGCDYRTGGTTIEDAVKAALLFEQEGIDLIDISGGLCSFVRKGHSEPGYFGDISSAIKNAVHIPVLLTGGVKTLKDADKLVKEGCADLIGVGRAITANAQWGMELVQKN